jgi:hypothetical protein
VAETPVAERPAFEQRHRRSDGGAVLARESERSRRTEAAAGAFDAASSVGGANAPSTSGAAQRLHEALHGRRGLGGLDETANVCST